MDVHVEVVRVKVNRRVLELLEQSEALWFKTLIGKILESDRVLIGRRHRKTEIAIVGLLLQRHLALLRVDVSMESHFASRHIDQEQPTAEGKVLTVAVSVSAELDWKMMLQCDGVVAEVCRRGRLNDKEVRDLFSLSDRECEIEKQIHSRESNHFSPILQFVHLF